MNLPKVIAKPLPPKVYRTESVGISRKTHDEHYKLYMGYVNKTNEIRDLLSGRPMDRTKANQIYSDIRALKADYTFALGGVKNHEVYFDSIGGDGRPRGAVADAIVKTFGSMDAFMDDLYATSMAARGWAWLAYDHDEQTLFTYLGDAQNTFPVWNATPILAVDTYEHAYYADFLTARARYLEALFRVLDWRAINARYEQLQRQ